MSYTQMTDTPPDADEIERIREFTELCENTFQTNPQKAFAIAIEHCATLLHALDEARSELCACGKGHYCESEAQEMRQDVVIAATAENRLICETIDERNDYREALEQIADSDADHMPDPRAYAESVLYPHPEGLRTDPRCQRKVQELTAERDALRAENEQLRREVREWICSRCMYVYPGPPQPGFKCLVCPRCEGSTDAHGKPTEGTTMPRSSYDLKQLRAEVERKDEALSMCLRTLEIELEHSHPKQPHHHNLKYVVRAARAALNLTPEQSLAKAAREHIDEITRQLTSDNAFGDTPESGPQPDAEEDES